MKTKREGGIDLVRTVGIIFVISWHFFLYNGFYYLPLEGGGMFAAASARWLFTSCNGLFMLLTGYLNCRKTLSAGYYSSIAPIFVSYLLSSGVNIAVRVLYGGETATAEEWIGKIFNYFAAKYGWYVEMYLGLFLLIPFINLIIERLTNARAETALLITLVTLTALPGLTSAPILPDYWTAFYPLTYYCIGAVIQRRKPAPKRLPCLAGALALAAGVGGLTVLTSGGGNISEGAYTQTFGGIWIVLIASLLFLGLYRTKPAGILRPLTRFAAKVSFESYLVSYVFDLMLYRHFRGIISGSGMFAGYFALCIPCILLSIAAGALLHLLSKGICNAAGKLYRFITSERHAEIYHETV